MVRRNADGTLTVGEVIEVAEQIPVDEIAPAEDITTEVVEEPAPKATETKTVQRKAGRPKRK